MIEIYTDGSCKGNPGPGGWAAIFLKTDSSSSEKKISSQKKVLEKVPEKILQGNNFHTTNNRMEMMGVISALQFLEKHDSKEKNITLYTDSNLIVQTINQGWKRKANLDLWREVDILMEKVPVKFVWIRGHAKNKWNEECDKIAVAQSALAEKQSRAASHHGRSPYS